MVVEARPIPAVEPEAGVVVLAGEDVGEGDWPLGCPPGGIGPDAFEGTVRRAQGQLETEPKGLVGRALGAAFVVAACGGIGVVPEGIGQHHADAIRAGHDQGRDVEVAVVDRLFVLGPGLVDARRGDPPSVDEGVIIAEANNPERGVGRAGGEEELFAEHREGGTVGGDGRGDPPGGFEGRGGFGGTVDVQGPGEAGNS